MSGILSAGAPSNMLSSLNPTKYNPKELEKKLVKLDNKRMKHTLEVDPVSESRVTTPALEQRD